jgi:hypothetical protein
MAFCVLSMLLKAFFDNDYDREPPIAQRYTSLRILGPSFEASFKAPAKAMKNGTPAGSGRRDGGRPPRGRPGT